MRPLVLLWKPHPVFEGRWVVHLWHRSSQSVVGSLVVKPRGATWNISWLGVDEGFQRQGWATRMLQHVEWQARRAGITTLQLEECLEDPSTIYTRLGYNYVVLNTMQKKLH